MAIANSLGALLSWSQTQCCFHRPFSRYVGCLCTDF